MKKNFILLCSLISILGLNACDSATESIENPHEHTYDLDKWECNEMFHWHKATCGHNEFNKDLENHDFGDDNICDTCGYTKPLPEAKYYNFNFVGYHCSANNQSTYLEDSLVNISFTVENGYYLPDSIDVIGTNEFNYNKDNKTLSLKINKDITVIVNALTDIPTLLLVSFDTDGGTKIDSIAVLEGGIFQKPANPKKDGYIFMNWYDNSDCSGDPYEFDNSVNSNLTLYACWGVEVTLLNYDETIISKTVIRVNDKMDKPDDPTYLNGHFDGWYTNPSYEGEKFDFDNKISCKTTLFAKYFYFVTFLDGNKNQYKIEKVSLGEKTSVPDNPSLDYHDFDSWYEDEQCSQKFNFNQVVSNDITLYSNFIPKTYNITYVGDSLISHSNPNKYSYGVGLELNEPINVQDGYKFYGWYFDKDFEEEATSIAIDSHNDVTLYAKVAEIYNITYTNWPSVYDNNNPTFYTIYDEIDIDISNILKSPGFKDITLTINGENKNKIAKGTTGDIKVEIYYTLSSTKITFYPNNGILLSDNSYIFIDFQIEGEEIVKFNLPNISDGNVINLYDPNILDIPLNSGHIFSGFTLDKQSKMKLSKEEFNDLPNGSTIFALWTEVTHPCITSMESELNTNHYFETFFIPDNVSKVLFNTHACVGSNGTVCIYTDEEKQNAILNETVSDLDLINDIILDVSDISQITIAVSFDDQKTDCYFIYSFSLIYSSCNVRTKESSIPIEETIKFGDTLTIGHAYREDHEFVGWFDINGNLYKSGSKWQCVEEEISLFAGFHYRFVNDLIEQVSKANANSRAALVKLLPQDDRADFEKRIDVTREYTISQLEKNVITKEEAEAIYEQCLKEFEEIIADARKLLDQ